VFEFIHGIRSASVVKRVERSAVKEYQLQLSALSDWNRIYDDVGLSASSNSA
jgi:hypothetical protein